MLHERAERDRASELLTEFMLGHLTAMVANTGSGFGFKKPLEGEDFMPSRVVAKQKVEDAVPLAERKRRAAENIVQQFAALAAARG